MSDDMESQKRNLLEFIHSSFGAGNVQYVEFPESSSWEIRIENYHKKNESAQYDTVTVGYDDSIGYTMYINGYTWEFDDNRAAFNDEAERYLTALRDHKLRFRKRKFNKYIHRGTDVYIDEK